MSPWGQGEDWGLAVRNGRTLVCLAWEGWSSAIKVAMNQEVLEEFLLRLIWA